MGRYSYSDRLVADSLKTVSIYYLRKHGYLTEGNHWGTLTWSCRGEKTVSISFRTYITEEEKYIEFDYIITRRDSSKKDNFEYKIPIETTDCHFGGKRYWFRCSLSKNGVYCGHRVAKLYQGADYFACRHCYNLTYESRNENPTYRGYPYNEILLRNKVDEIEKTMRKRTYKGKLTKKHMRIRRIEKRMLNPYVEDYILEELLYKV